MSCIEGFGSQRLSFSTKTPRGSPQQGSPPASWFRRRKGGSVASNTGDRAESGSMFGEEVAEMDAASTPVRNGSPSGYAAPMSPARAGLGGREDSMDDAFANIFEQDNSFSNADVPDTPPHASKAELGLMGQPHSPSAMLSTSVLDEPIDAASSQAPKKNHQKKQGTELFKAVIFGVINGIIILPVMIGFAQIIFRHKFFVP